MNPLTLFTLCILLYLVTYITVAYIFYRIVRKSSLTFIRYLEWSLDSVNEALYHLTITIVVAMVIMNLL